MSNLYINNNFTPQVRTLFTRKLKMNNVTSWLGNAAQENLRLAYVVGLGYTGIQLYGLYEVFGDATLEGRLATLINKAYTVYGLQTVGAIMGSGRNGFQKVLDYNATVGLSSQFNDFNKENEFWNYFRVDFQIDTPAVIPYAYTITLNGTPYGYTSSPGNTPAQIATALAAACAPSGLSISVSTDTIRIKDTTSVYASYTYSTGANITVTPINETYTDWIDSMQWLDTQLVAGQMSSAYVANPANNWGLTEATDMVQCIDIYEGTNYTTSPNELQTAFRDHQLFYIADAAAALSITQQYVPILSAEDPPCSAELFMGTYFQSTGGIATGEALWTSQWNADAFTNKASLINVGWSYFDYNCLKTFVP